MEQSQIWQIAVMLITLDLCLHRCARYAVSVGLPSCCTVHDHTMCLVPYTVRSIRSQFTPLHHIDTVFSGFSSLHCRRPDMGGADSGDSTKRKRKDNVDDKFALVYTIREGDVLQIVNGLFSGAAYAGSAALCANIYQLYSPGEARAANAIMEAIGGEAAAIGGLAVVVSLSLLFAKIVRMIPLRIYKHETSWVAFSVFVVVAIFYFSSSSSHIIFISKSFSRGTFHCSYMAIFQSAVPFQNRQFTFVKGDLHETTPYKWLPRIVLRGRQVANVYRLEDIAIILHHTSFRKPVHLLEMMSNADTYIRRTKSF